MNENARKIQMVMDTLQNLDMKPTYDNCNHMLGCLQVLAALRDELRGPQQEENGQIIGLKDEQAAVPEDVKIETFGVQAKS